MNRRSFFLWLAWLMVVLIWGLFGWVCISQAKVGYIWMDWTNEIGCVLDTHDGKATGKSWTQCDANFDSGWHVVSGSAPSVHPDGNAHNIGFICCYDQHTAKPIHLANYDSTYILLDRGWLNGLMGDGLEYLNPASDSYIGYCRGMWSDSCASHLWANWCQIVCNDADGDDIPDDDDCYPDDSTRSGKLALEGWCCDSNNIRTGGWFVDSCGHEYEFGNWSDNCQGGMIFLGVTPDGTDPNYEYDKIGTDDCSLQVDGALGVSCFADRDNGDMDNPPDYEANSTNCVPDTLISCGCGGGMRCLSDGHWGLCYGSDCDKDGVETPADPDDDNPDITQGESDAPDTGDNPGPGDNPGGTSDNDTVPGETTDSGDSGSITGTDINGTITLDLGGNVSWTLPEGNIYPGPESIVLPEQRDIKNTILARINSLRVFRVDTSLSGAYCSFDCNVFGQIKTINWCWLGDTLDKVGLVGIAIASFYALFIVVGKR